MLKEGAATQGVWLPLALAQIYQALIALIKMWAAKESGIKVPTTAEALKAHGLTVHGVLQNNDAFHALQKVGGLIMTGPTGTNVNDVAVALIWPEV